MVALYVLSLRKVPKKCHILFEWPLFFLVNLFCAHLICPPENFLFVLNLWNTWTFYSTYFRVKKQMIGNANRCNCLISIYFRVYGEEILHRWTLLGQNKTVSIIISTDEGSFATRIFVVICLLLVFDKYQQGQILD